MKLIITFLLALTSFCFSQDFWEQTNGPFGGPIYALDINSNGNVFAGTQGGGVFRSLDDGDNWIPINNGLPELDVFTLVINSSEHIFGGISGGGIIRSTDNGENWTKINNGLPNNTPDNYFHVRTLKTSSNETILAGTQNGDIYRSIDNGDNWSQLDFEINADYDKVRALEINASGHIFAGTYGGIFRSIDNGESWEKLNLDLPASRSGYVRALEIKSNGYVFAAVDHYVFRSNDNGENWVELTGFDGWGIESLVINSQDHIFTGADGTGVYCSKDNGETWTNLNSGLTDTFVYSLAINSNDYVFAGTHDGFVFRSKNPTTSIKEVYEVPIIFALEQNYPNPFNPNTTIKYQIPEQVRNDKFSVTMSGVEESFVTLKVYDVLGREVATLVNQKQKTGYYKVEWNAINQPSGVYFYQLTAGASTGSATDFVEIKKMILLR